MFVPDFLTTLRNAPALLWLRARGVTVILQMQNAPEAGPFYRWLWRRAINPVIALFVCNSEFTKRELLACGIADEKALIIANAVSPRRRS